MLPEELVRILAGVGISPGWDVRDVEIERTYSAKAGSQVIRFRWKRPK